MLHTENESVDLWKSEWAKNHRPPVEADTRKPATDERSAKSATADTKFSQAPSPVNFFSVRAQYLASEPDTLVAEQASKEEGVLGSMGETHSHLKNSLPNLSVSANNRRSVIFTPKLNRSVEIGQEQLFGQHVATQQKIRRY